MKTQIIFRTILIAAIMLTSYSIKGDNSQAIPSSSPVTVLNYYTPLLKNAMASFNAGASQNSTSLCCLFCTHQNESPVIPEPNGEHEFHAFHVKGRAHKYTGFWKNIGNKIVEAVYYIVVLLTFMPFKH